jgi:hypothetical protein
MKITEGIEFGGPYVRIDMPNGKVVFVWETNIEDSEKSVIQIYDKNEHIENGESPSEQMSF